MDVCKTEVPELEDRGGQHWVACHLDEAPALEVL
jgi:hypothetical protein